MVGGFTGIVFYGFGALASGGNAASWCYVGAVRLFELVRVWHQPALQGNMSHELFLPMNL